MKLDLLLFALGLVGLQTSCAVKLDGASVAPLLAKPARVPFTEHAGSILVHASESLLQSVQCRNPAVEIKDERGFLHVNRNWRSVFEVHTDRQERQWKHVTVDFSAFSVGVTAVAVTVCGEMVVTKVSLVCHPLIAEH